MQPTYDNVYPIVSSYQVQGTKAIVAFTCPATGQRITSQAAIRRGFLNTQAQMGARTAYGHARKNLGRYAQNMMGGGFMGGIARMAADEATRQTVRRAPGGAVQQQHSDADQQAAVLDAFKRVQNQFSWDPDLEAWCAIPAGQQVRAAPAAPALPPPPKGGGRRMVDSGPAAPPRREAAPQTRTPDRAPPTRTPDRAAPTRTPDRAAPSRAPDRIATSASARASARTERTVSDVTEFHRIVGDARLTERHDQWVLAKMMAELARADGRIDQSERAIFSAFANSDIGRIDILAREAPIRPDQFRDVTPGLGEALMLMALAVAYSDNEFHDRERRLLTGYQQGLGISAARQPELELFAAEQVVDSMFEAMWEHGEPEAQHLQSVEQAGRVLGLTAEDVDIAERRVRARFAS